MRRTGLLIMIGMSDHAAIPMRRAYYMLNPCGAIILLCVLSACETGPTTLTDDQTKQGAASSVPLRNPHPEHLFRAQRFDEAAQSFMQQARAGGNDEHKAWFNAGASYWNAGRQTEALEAYEQAVAVNPLYAKGHLRLTNKYASLRRTELSAKHKKHAKAIQQITKVMLPYWDKANQLRGRGADYDYAAATIHDASAKYYDEQGMSELAAAERKLTDRSRADGQVAKARLELPNGKRERRPKSVPFGRKSSARSRI